VGLVLNHTADLKHRDVYKLIGAERVREVSTILFARGTDRPSDLQVLGFGLISHSPLANERLIYEYCLACSRSDFALNHIKSGNPLARRPGRRKGPSPPGVRRYLIVLPNCMTVPARTNVDSYSYRCQRLVGLCSLACSRYAIFPSRPR